MCLHVGVFVVLWHCCTRTISSLVSSDVENISLRLRKMGVLSCVRRMLGKVFARYNSVTPARGPRKAASREAKPRIMQRIHTTRGSADSSLWVS